MSKSLEKLKKHLKSGQIYRRSDLTGWSNAVDRHINELVEEGVLRKLYQGLYCYPKKTPFGELLPEDDKIVQAFLRDDDFLITSYNTYNSLGLGTTQLYNHRIVYNHKRHGHFVLGGRDFDFRVKHYFPNKITEEFLLIDLMNNIDEIAEDKAPLKEFIAQKAKNFDLKKLGRNIRYGTARTKKFFEPILKHHEQYYA